MIKWEDREYINPRKKVFKNMDTNEILNLEVQEDLNNIVKESETPLSAYCLNMAQQELVDDMSKIYTGTSITADTVEGYGRINKIYGKTEEIGTGEKSLTNAYILKCIGDNGQIETISKNGSNTSSNIVHIDKPLYSNGSVKDELDYGKGKITRRCGEVVLNGTENWTMAETVSDIARFVNFNNNVKVASHFICNKLKVINQPSVATFEECITRRDLSQDNAISIIIKTNRLSSIDTNGFKAFLASNPIILIYELATPIVETIDCSNKIVQYDGQTTVYNKDNAEIEVSLTNNKAISEVNEDIKNTEENLIKSTELDDKTVIKFADGTMIETGTVTCTYASASLLSANINFSETFANIPTVVLTRQLSLSEAYQQFANVGYNNITTSQATVRIRAEANVSFVAGNIMQVCYQAIGRWK